MAYMYRNSLAIMVVAILGSAAISPAGAVKIELWTYPKENAVLNNSSKMKRDSFGNPIFLPDLKQPAPKVIGEYPNGSLKSLWVSTLKRSPDITKLLKQFKLNVEDLPMPIVIADGQTGESPCYAADDIYMTRVMMRQQDVPFAQVGVSTFLSSGVDRVHDSKKHVLELSCRHIAEQLVAAYGPYRNYKYVLSIPFQTLCEKEISSYYAECRHKHTKPVEDTDKLKQKLREQHEQSVLTCADIRLRLVRLAGVDEVDRLDFEPEQDLKENPPSLDSVYTLFHSEQMKSLLLKY